MSDYNFYYDESEHSRKINLNTINAENYYDNFITVVVGWEEKNEEKIFSKYLAFEEKYKDRKAEGELKSTTLKAKQFTNGFSSLNKNNVQFLNDFFAIFDEDIFIYFCTLSKTQYIIEQVFTDYKNSFLCDMDALKYSIVKAIRMYQPKRVIKCLFEDTENLINELKSFFGEKVKYNEDNQSLKERETQTFKEILLILDDVQDIKTVNWDYSTAFIGFKEYLLEKGITNYTLTIDDEENTFIAAEATGIKNVVKDDSKKSIGIRISDMLAGILAKLMKSINNALRYKNEKESLQKKLFSDSWFILSDGQLNLYKTLRYILCELNDAWYKSFSGTYSDDLIVLISLLNYFSQFKNSSDITKNIDMRGEELNTYMCSNLEDYFKRIKNKLPIEFIPQNEKDFYLNQRCAKVFYDTAKQPKLKISEGRNEFYVLSVGVDNKLTPLITIEEKGVAICYKLPQKLSEWAFSVAGFANLGDTLFPATVIFTKNGNNIYADIL